MKWCHYQYQKQNRLLEKWVPWKPAIMLTQFGVYSVFFPNHEIAVGEETFSVMLVRTQAKAKLNSSFFNNENCHEWRIVDNDDELTAKLENDNNGDTRWLWELFKGMAEANVMEDLHLLYFMCFC